jgi:butyrate response factor
MSSWYRDSSTWFEASDAQAWIPSNQNVSQNYNHTSPIVPDVKTLKTPKSNMSQRMSKEVKNQPQAMVPPRQDKFFELPSHSVEDSQNAWNDYVLLKNTSNDDFLDDWDTPSPTTGNEVQAIPTKPEKVVFSKLKRNVDIEEELTKQNRYKTELCQSWIATGACRYGPKCQFAHGKYELNYVIRHPKYKTEICKTFSTTGQCPYGKRCRFVHQLTELRMDDPTEEEMAQIQLKLQEISLSLAPDPVFPSSGYPITAPPSATTTNIKKGSRLPFLQKLRKQL